ncbi:hypothetical protein M2132_000097 [Dysgonomonas sp. PH5-45]|uniref:head GIN domain-containing protein n=1 Tax=unclassified Dysgonomonas TaxID=2630389 RepID=UPI0024751249|nr:MULTISPECIES: head GIN domain-containing protein [unclassified Dysgonomonas]MDH6353780.1 hypothetical protein [Dysgonomonas sp. PH5-45]MDH6386682.1 hypothetical protein [Dysgonomonas sp. PH5-37]
MNTKSAHFLFILLFAVLLQTSCTITKNNNDTQKIKGSGKIVSREYTISDYDLIVLETGGQLIYEKKTETAPYIRVETDDNIQPEVIVKVHRKTLTIDMHPSSDIRPTRFTIYTNSRSLHEAVIKGSGNILLKGPMYTEFLGLLVEGSGDIKAEELQCQETNMKIAGSGDIELSGKSRKLTCVIEGSGDMNLFDYESQTAQCFVQGSGDIKVNVTQKLTAAIEGSGDILYIGNPENVHKNIKGSGSIKQR